VAGGIEQLNRIGIDQTLVVQPGQRRRSQQHGAEHQAHGQTVKSLTHMSWEYARTVVLVPTLPSMLYRAMRTLHTRQKRHAPRPQAQT
jgi:hypothetical protein